MTDRDICMLLIGGIIGLAIANIVFKGVFP